MTMTPHVILNIKWSTVLSLSDWYCIPSAESREHNKLIIWIVSRYNFSALSGIQTWDLSVCLYFNLKHGNLDRSATKPQPYFATNPQKSSYVFYFYKTLNISLQNDTLTE